MKKFIISVLCVSVFFIGLGGLVEKTSANFKSDARALELVRLARVAIGGEANINNVRSMTISGTSSRAMTINGASEIKQGSLEINFEFPGKFSKMVRIGEPGDGGGEIQKQFDVIVTRSGEMPETVDSGEGKKVVIVKDENGNVLTENIKGGDGQRKIVIKSKNGETEDIRAIDNGNGATITTEDGKKILVDKDVKIIRTNGGDARQNEMLRTTLFLLLTAPEGSDVSYTFAGETTVDGAACNIVEAASNGSVFKLFLDKATNLPKMISYMAAPMKIFKFEKPASADAANKKEVQVFVNKMDKIEPVEHQLKLSDFRSVGGLLLPHKWTESVGGETVETVDVSNYEINPTNISEKFKKEKVFVRTQKDQ